MAIAAGAISSPAYARDHSGKIAIIKADDVHNKTGKWQRFFAVSREKGVKVSAGIICDSLEGDKWDYAHWLKDLQSSGWVEFWNHGWDHKRWETSGSKKMYEFSGTGYDHQKNHFGDSQDIIKRVLGSAPIAFGAPFNAIDSNTVKVMNESPEMRLFFCLQDKGLKD